MVGRDELPLVIVTRELPRAWLAPLEGRCRLVAGEADRAGFGPRTRQALPRAEGMLCTLTERVDAALLEHAPRLRVVSNLAVGVDNIDVEACAGRGIAVGNTPGVLTDATADLTLALMLAAARRLREASDDARAGRWSLWSPTGWLGMDLADATLGLVGYGKIGRAVAARARAFGMRVVAAARPSLPAGVEALDLAALLSVSDVVSLHVPLTGETEHMIDEAALRRMKPSAWLVNTSRGRVIDQQALVRALTQGSIAGAALDVTDPEPLPPTDPLYALPNALVTPHIGSATEGTRRRMAELAIENLLAGLEGRPLPHAAGCTRA